MSADLAPLPTTVRERQFLVVWQRPDRSFVPVGQLDVRRDEHDNSHSRFQYLPTASSEVDFEPLLAFPDLDRIYERDGELLPFFANRVMSPRRPDFGQSHAFDATLTTLSPGSSSPWPRRSTSSVSMSTTARTGP